MNIHTANTSELNLFFANFFNEKNLEQTSFHVQTKNYGDSYMPFEVVIDALISPQQNLGFLRQVAEHISKLDYMNAPKNEFNKALKIVANNLAKNI